MNFSQYMSAGQGGDVTGGPIADLICFEDGTCMPRPAAPSIGTAHDPNDFRTGWDSHRTYGDGTGGHFIPTRDTVTPVNAVYASDQTGGPQPTGPLPVGRPTASSRPGMDLAQLINIMRMERDAFYARRRPEQRTRGDR